MRKNIQFEQIDLFGFAHYVAFENEYESMKAVYIKSHAHAMQQHEAVGHTKLSPLPPNKTSPVTRDI